jgi:ribosomal protein S18 acetylase RimI-like enzyme
MVIRRYREADRPALRAITAEAFRGVCIDQNIERIFGPAGDIHWQERKGRHIDDDVRAHAAGVFVAEDEGEVVGYVTTRLDRWGKVGQVANFAVRRDRQGQGIGRRLIEHALDYFREQGMLLARIETLVQNDRCMDFYPKLGFREVARQVYFAMRL